ncbi:MAG: hypothetical protein ABFD61_00435 [Chloroherpetonaceae bacterium]
MKELLTPKRFFIIVIFLMAFPLFGKSNNLEFTFYTAGSNCNNCTFAGLNTTISNINQMFSSPPIKVYASHPIKMMMKNRKFTTNVEIFDAVESKNEAISGSNVLVVQDANGLVLLCIDDFQRNSLQYLIAKTPFQYIDSVKINTLLIDSVKDNIGSLYSETIYNGDIKIFSNSISFIDKVTNKIFIIDTLQKKILQTIDMPDTFNFFAYYQDKRDIIHKELIYLNESGYFSAKFEKIFSFSDSTIDFLSTLITNFKIDTTYDDNVKDTVIFLRPTMAIERIKYNFINDKILSIENLEKNISEAVSPVLFKNQIFYFTEDYFKVRFDTNLTVDSINDSPFYLIESMNLNDYTVKKYLKAKDFFKTANIKASDLNSQFQFPIFLPIDNGLIISLIDTVLLFIDYETGSIKKMDIPAYLRVYKDLHIISDISKTYNQNFLNSNYDILRSLFPLSDGFIFTLKLVRKNSNIVDYINIGRYDNNGNLKENKVLYLKPYGKINFVESFSMQNNEVYFIGILNNEKIITFSVKI